MAETGSDERTEQPTGRRIQQAREEGQIARSQDFSAAMILLFGLIALRFLGGRLIVQLGANQTLILDRLFELRFTPEEMLPYLMGQMTQVLRMLTPFMGVVFLIAVGVNVGQVGFIFTTKTMTFNPNIFNPGAGLKRMFSRRSLARFFQSLLKAALVGMVAYWAVKGEYGNLVRFMHQDARGIVAGIGIMLFNVAMKIALVLLLLAIVDLIYQRWEYKQDLRMTKQEVKDELRQLEGDPKMKSRRKQLQLRVAMQRMMQAVPEADVIITNPTHLAVAVRYDADTMEAPKVVAKGADQLAWRIRQIAHLHGVPVVEKKPLARMLYRLVEVGDPVPDRLYRSVAEVLAYVYKLSDRHRKHLEQTIHA